MGEGLEEFARSAAADTAAAASAPVLGSAPAARAADGYVVPEELPEWLVRARKPLDEKHVLEEVTPGSIEAARVVGLHTTMQTRARLYAHHLRQLATSSSRTPRCAGCWMMRISRR